jgi:23S rRNA G2445 N2-methylase RlmL
MKRIELELSEEKYQELQQLMATTRAHSTTELFNNALTLFVWAVTETQSGRTIASVDEEHSRFKELTMESLLEAKNARAKVFNAAF